MWNTQEAKSSSVVDLKRKECLQSLLPLTNQYNNKSTFRFTLFIAFAHIIQGLGLNCWSYFWLSKGNTGIMFACDFILMHLNTLSSLFQTTLSAALYSVYFPYDSPLLDYHSNSNLCEINRQERWADVKMAEQTNKSCRKTQSSTTAINAKI